MFSRQTPSSLLTTLFYHTEMSIFPPKSTTIVKNHGCLRSSGCPSINGFTSTISLSLLHIYQFRIVITKSSTPYLAIGGIEARLNNHRHRSVVPPVAASPRTENVYIQIDFLNRKTIFVSKQVINLNVF